MLDREKLQTAATFLVLIWVSVPQRLTAQCESGTVGTGTDCPPVEQTYRHGRWFVSETANFHVSCEGSEASAVNLARRAEELRRTLRAKWLGEASMAVWRPRCQIVLYASQRSYVAAVGRGSDRTVGSSLVSAEKGHITKRRIDLVGGSTDYLSTALPHELTHVVLRDRFPSTVLPRWADEGMAILADPQAKQNRHRRDLLDALASRRTFPAAQLLSIDDYPAPSRVGTLYGQSASLTKFLVTRKSPEQFVEFIDRALANGYDVALQECYGIAGVGELDRQWRRQVYSVRQASGEEPAPSAKPLVHADVAALPLANMWTFAQKRGK